MQIMNTMSIGPKMKFVMEFDFRAVLVLGSFITVIAASSLSYMYNYKFCWLCAWQSSNFSCYMISIICMHYSFIYITPHIVRLENLLISSTRCIRLWRDMTQLLVPSVSSVSMLCLQINLCGSCRSPKQIVKLVIATWTHMKI